MIKTIVKNTILSCLVLLHLSVAAQQSLVKNYSRNVHPSLGLCRFQLTIEKLPEQDAGRALYSVQQVTVFCGKQKMTTFTVGEATSYSYEPVFDDYNFDGYVDVAIPVAEGYGGVNHFFALYFYNAASRTWYTYEPVSSMAEIKKNSSKKELTAHYKSGPQWYTAFYKLYHGRFYMYKEAAEYPQKGEPAVKWYNPDGTESNQPPARRRKN